MTASSVGFTIVASDAKCTTAHNMLAWKNSHLGAYFADHKGTMIM